GQFWTLWVLYFISAGAGLMVIGSISGMAKLSMGEQAFLAVAILAIGNAAGRVIAGSLSDRFGRRRVLTSVLALQAALMFLAVYAASSGSAWFIVLVATAVGFNYGANLAIFPSYAKDLWGMPHFGANYGLLFTAWGVGGFVMSRLSEWLRVETGNYSMSFIVAGVLLCGGVAIKLTFRDHKSHARAATAQAATGVKLPAETSPQVR
ncbi:MAG TPA: MFS transporter, partial [Usitatibacteraceae bacterium]|nr:MFS transporter [Usitatibacteraceae bacterium]